MKIQWRTLIFFTPLLLLTGCNDDETVEVEVPVEVPVVVNPEHEMLTDPFLQLPTPSTNCPLEVHQPRKLLRPN
ncbi:hypothetical protein [uncultured Alteromonas sp.]|jgi:hypothetical protein|uniref:hypothetical protein n=1 Tax=uncultured Alteromonas sp. TaxID=179113 RepID=UPI0025830F9E|nr:hypothetical protein [uncultured Alteromonas sp.]